MMKKIGIIKRRIATCLIFLMCINSFGAVVSDNDGSAFITKAEFDSLKNNFQSQIDQYNTSIDSKIDGAIAAYLSGIRLSLTQQLANVYMDNGNVNCKWIDLNKLQSREQTTNDIAGGIIGVGIRVETNFDDKNIAGIVGAWNESIITQSVSQLTGPGTNPFFWSSYGNCKISEIRPYVDTNWTGERASFFELDGSDFDGTTNKYLKRWFAYGEVLMAFLSMADYKENMVWNSNNPLTYAPPWGKQIKTNVALRGNPIWVRPNDCYGVPCFTSVTYTETKSYSLGDCYACGETLGDTQYCVYENDTDVMFLGEIPWIDPTPRWIKAKTNDINDGMWKDTNKTNMPSRKYTKTNYNDFCNQNEQLFNGQKMKLYQGAKLASVPGKGTLTVKFKCSKGSLDTNVSAVPKAKISFSTQPYDNSTTITGDINIKSVDGTTKNVTNYVFTVDSAEHTYVLDTQTATTLFFKLQPITSSNTLPTDFGPYVTINFTDNLVFVSEE